MRPPAEQPSAAPSASSSVREAAWLPASRGALHEAGAFRNTTAHGGGLYELRVLASDVAAYGSAAEFPSETTICAEHRRSPGGASGPLACMQKRASGWRFAVALTPFVVWDREGDLVECAGCHATAPRDHVFGPP